MKIVLPPGRPKAKRASSGGSAVHEATSVRYHRPARLDDQLLVTAQVLDIGHACMTISQQARLGLQSAGDLLCEATIRIGWVVGSTFKPARIPPTILEALQ